MDITSKETQNRIVEMYTTIDSVGHYLSAVEIAVIFEVSQYIIFSVLRKNNVEIRGISETLLHHRACKPIKNLPPEGQPAPFCKCGCGNSVKWSQRQNKWLLYFDGHYRKDALYKDEDWLRHQYVDLHRTAEEIAEECGVCHSSIYKSMRKLNISTRSQPESLVLRGSVSREKNPAWLGGIAKWDYAPNWKALARSVRMRDKYVCQSCGLTKKRWGVGLHVHHIDHDKTNNSLDNLISLCAQCHREVHTGQDY